jgi:gluconolactonase
MTWDFEIVAKGYAFTEGPAWDGSGVLFGDVPESRLLRYDAETGETAVHYENTLGGTGTKFDDEGNLYVCEGGERPLRGRGRRITRYEPDGQRTVLVERYDGDRFNGPTDLEVDDEGRVWFTDPDHDDVFTDSDSTSGIEIELNHESVYRLDPAAETPWDVTRVTHDTDKPNGILLSPEGDWLYVAQNSDHDPEMTTDLRGYPVDADGSLGKPRVLHNFAPHRGIAGMCLDADGNIVATAGAEWSGPGPMIYVFAPSGRVLETHPFPEFPTGCAFGGADYQDLYVTGGGCLFRAETDRTGYHQPF